jgi:hypothetical protein
MYELTSGFKRVLSILTTFALLLTFIPALTPSATASASDWGAGGLTVGDGAVVTITPAAGATTLTVTGGTVTIVSDGAVMLSTAAIINIASGAKVIWDADVFNMGITLRGNGVFVMIGGSFVREPPGIVINMIATGTPPSSNAALILGGTINDSSTINITGTNPNAVAITRTATKDTYDIGSNDDLTLHNNIISDTTAVWDYVNGKHGISYKRGTNEGFIEVPDVTVVLPPVYKISHDVASNSHTFNAADYGYAAQTPLTAEVENTGNRPTGNLTVEPESGEFFEIINNDAADGIEVGGTATFEVRPKTGLDASSTAYTDKVTISGDNGISASFDVSFTVNAAQLPAPANVTVTNGEVGWESVTNAASYTINIYKDAVFKVAVTDQTGTSYQLTNGSWLDAAGDDYTVSVTAVSGNPNFTDSSEGISNAFAVYTVTLTVEGIEPSDTVSFGGMPRSTNAQFTVFAIHGTTVAFSATAGAGRQVTIAGSVSSSGHITNITEDKAITAAFDISPLESLGQVTGAALSAAGRASWDDLADEEGLGHYSILLHKDGSSLVASETSGAGTGEAGVCFLDVIRAAGAGEYTVTVTAVGDGVTRSSGAVSAASGAQTVAKLPAPVNLAWSGTNAAFDKLLVEDNVANYTIAVDGTGTAGAVVAKTGSNLIVAVTNPADGDTFKVRAVAMTTGLWLDSDESVASAAYVTPEYGVSHNVAGNAHIFTAAGVGYAEQPGLDVTVTNTGIQATGDLTVELSGADSGSFTLSKTTIDSLAVGGYGGFTVVPNTGLSVRIYTADVVISGGNITQVSFTVSFTVNTVPSGAKEITSFMIGDAAGDIDHTAETIAVTLPFGTSVTNLAPTITVSPEATVDPPSGEPRDFTSPVTYTVTAEDGTLKEYTVTVTVSSQQREATPSAAIDFGNERLTGLTADAVYIIGGTEYTAEDGNIPITDAWLGEEIEIVRKATGDNLNSDPQNLAIPSRPSAPSGVDKTDTTNGNNNGMITGVEETMEYRLSTASVWTPVSGTQVTGLAPGTYHVRLKATGSAFASTAVQVSIAGSDAPHHPDPPPDTPPSPTPDTSPSPSPEPTPPPGIPDLIEDAIESSGGNVTVQAPIGEDTGTAEVRLVMQNIEDMAENGITLTVQAGDIRYDIPASAVNIAEIMQALGSDDPQDVQITITISTVIDEEKQKMIDDAASLSGFELVFPPIRFSVTASYNGGTVEITLFNQFIGRTIEITENDAARITTAVVIEQDGTVRHVPTSIYQQDGKWYAVINSLTNSTYALIYNDVSFADAVDKWFESVTRELGSRRIVYGIGGGLFDGERDITRAEIVTVIVRALGLPLTQGGSSFTDVPSGAWYSGYVETAYMYGLAGGIGGGRFAPDRPVTREEAMLIVFRAAQLAGYGGDFASIQDFPDAARVSAWALDAARWNAGSQLVVGKNAKLLAPGESISRAELAAIVLKLLRDAGLIDEREELREIEPRKEPDPPEVPEGDEDDTDGGGDDGADAEMSAVTPQQAVQLLNELLGTCNAAKVI